MLDTHVIPQKPRLEDEKLVKESPQILKKKIKLHLSSEQTGSPGVSTQLRKEANPLPTNDQSMTPSKNPFESFLTKKLKAAPNNDSLDAKESTESSKDNEVVQSTDNEDVDSKSESRKTNKEDEVNSGSSKDEVEEKVDTEMDCDGSKEDLEDSSINTNVLDAHETGNGKEEESPNDQIVDDKLLAENDLQDKASIKDQVPINMRGKVESEKLETTENVLANFESKLDSVEKPGDENLETQIPSGEVVSLEQLPSILDCHVLLPAKQLSKDHDKKTKHCIQNGNFESGLVESKMDAELTKGIENVDAKLEVVVIDSKVGITKRIEAANENDISESPKCEELADSNESGDEKEHFEIANNDAQKKEELAAKELDITNNENDKEILVSKNPVILIGTNAAKAESPESDQLDQMDICEPCDFEYAMESSELLNESRKEPRNHTPAKDNTMSCSNYVVQPLADISRGPDVDFSGVMSEFITSLATTPMSKQILGKKSSSPMSQTSESGKPKIIRKSSTPNSQSIIRTRSRSVREASTPIPLQKIRKIKITGTESESELAKVTSTAQHQLNETPTRNSSAVNQTSPTPIQFSSNEVYNNPSKDISSTQNENEIKSSPIPLTITRIQGPSSKPEHPPIDTVASTQNMAKIKPSKQRKATPIQIPSNSDKPPFKPIVSTQIKGKSNEPKKKKATPIQVPSNKVDTRFIGTVEVLSRSANPSIDTVETGEDGTLAIAPIGSFSPHGSLTRRKALQDYCIPSRLTYTDSSEANVDENQANGERLDGLRNQLLESPLAKQKQQSDIMSRRVTLAVLPTSSNNSKQSPIGNSKSLISKHPTATSFAAPLPEQLSATISSDNIVSKQRRHSSFKGSYLLP